MPQVRWIADALTVLQQPVDWERIGRLAKHAAMEARLAHAVRYLRDRFAAPVPERFPETLATRAPRWQEREYRILLKPCPLGVVDSAAWHVDHFRRIRPFDEQWSHTPGWRGFPEYLQEFLGAQGRRDATRRLWEELKARGRGSTGTASGR